MSYQLTFASHYNYGTEAIIIPVELEFADKLVRADAYMILVPRSAFSSANSRPR